MANCVPFERAGVQAKILNLKVVKLKPGADTNIKSFLRSQYGSIDESCRKFLKQCRFAGRHEPAAPRRLSYVGGVGTRGSKTLNKIPDLHRFDTSANIASHV
jgi:hypothetical protein